MIGPMLARASTGAVIFAALAYVLLTAWAFGDEWQADD